MINRGGNMTNAEKQAREQEMNKKFEDRIISADNEKHTLAELNDMFGGDCSAIGLEIGGSQGVTSREEELEYKTDFTTLENVIDYFYQMLAENAWENLEDYLEDLLDGQDPDEMDEDELDELKGEAQAEAECDSGERLLVITMQDGGKLYYEIVGEDFIFSHCYYF
jgi:hypothetical protein